MRYQGGKFTAAPYICDQIYNTPGVTTDLPVVEPMCGGCSMTDQLVQWGFAVSASDINPSLILMWQAAMAADLPSFHLSPELFAHYKHPDTPDSAEKALVRFGASFGANWEGGIAQDAGHTPSDFVARSVRAVNRQAAIMRGHTTFACHSYLDIPPTSGHVYYLDPPYAGTSRIFRDFSAEVFWDWAQSRARDNFVFVSEYDVPVHIEATCIWTRDTRLSIANRAGQPGRVQTERLYRL